MSEKRDELTMKYFVLKPKGFDEYARASREAMRKYASVIGRTNPKLATELRAWAHEEAMDFDGAKEQGDE